MQTAMQSASKKPGNDPKIKNMSRPFRSNDIVGTLLPVARKTFAFASRIHSPAASWLSSFVPRIQQYRTYLFHFPVYRFAIEVFVHAVHITSRSTNDVGTTGKCRFRSGAISKRFLYGGPELVRFWGRFRRRGGLFWNGRGSRNNVQIRERICCAWSLGLRVPRPRPEGKQPVDACMM